MKLRKLLPLTVCSYKAKALAAQDENLVSQSGYLPASPVLKKKKCSENKMPKLFIEHFIYVMEGWVDRGEGI